MNCRAIAGRLLVVGAVTLFGLTTLSPVLAHADSVANNTNTVPLEITPVCADASSQSAVWKVVNKNVYDVEIDWTAIDNGHMGTYQAPAGETSMNTYYDATDPNNTTSFDADGFSTPTQTNSSNTACQPTMPVDPPTTACVDGSDQTNLLATKIGDDSYSIQTKDGGLLCNDVTIYESSYIMPADFDGNADYQNGSFVDSSAYPQYIFDSTSVVLSAGTTGLHILTVTLPDSCNNVQTDLYYAPEIETVGVHGHGAQNILSNILPSTGSCQTGGDGGGDQTPPTQPVGGGMGGGTVETASNPVVTTPVTAAPASLVDTGTNAGLYSVIAGVLLAAALLIATRPAKTSK